MINPEWENALVNYFVALDKLDEQCEELRVELCQDHDFVPKTTFELLDKDKKNFLSLTDFKATLSGVTYNEDSLRRFIRNYDKDSDFAINFDEFLGIVLPKKNDSLKEETLDRQESSVKEINQKFINLLNQEFQLFKQLTDLATELKSLKDFTTYESFLAIARNEKYITMENLQKFLDDHGVKLEEKNIEILLGRIDADSDGKISYDEFLQIFFPYRTNFVSKSPIRDIPKTYENVSYSSVTNNYNYSPVKVENPKNYNLKSSSTYDYNYDYSSGRNIPVESTNDVSYRAKLNTYSSPKRDLTPVKAQFRKSPVNFERSPRFSPNRTNVYKSPSPQRRTNLSPFRSPICCCRHCCCTTCSCCCIEHKKRLTIFNYLNDIIDAESNVESIKESLAFCSDANLPDLFGFFDYRQTGFISQEDIISAFKEIEYYPSRMDINYLFKRYNKYPTGGFSYDEFCEMVLPRKFAIAKLMNERIAPTYFLGFTQETKRNLICLINSLIEAEKSNERKRTLVQMNMNVIEVFNLLKGTCEGISKDDISFFMEENGKFMTPYEEDFIMNRIDVNQDGIIDLNELKSYLMK